MEKIKINLPLHVGTSQTITLWIYDSTGSILNTGGDVLTETANGYFESDLNESRLENIDYYTVVKADGFVIAGDYLYSNQTEIGLSPANKVVPESKVQSDSRQAEITTSINNLNDFNPATDDVARVTLVDTTITNTDMRGTDGANTVIPDNAGILSAINSIPESLTSAEIEAIVTLANSNIPAINTIITELGKVVKVDELINYTNEETGASDQVRQSRS